jgi:hypothetical protein
MSQARIPVVSSTIPGVALAAASTSKTLEIESTTQWMRRNTYRLGYVEHDQLVSWIRRIRR